MVPALAFLFVCLFCCVVYGSLFLLTVLILSFQLSRQGHSESKTNNQQPCCLWKDGRIWRLNTTSVRPAAPPAGLVKTLAWQRIMGGGLPITLNQTFKKIYKNSLQAQFTWIFHQVPSGWRPTINGCHVPV